MGDSLDAGEAAAPSPRGAAARRARFVLALTLLCAVLQFAAARTQSLWGDEIASIATAAGVSWFPDAADMERVLDAEHFRAELELEPGYVGGRLVSVLERDTQLPLYYQLLTCVLALLGNGPLAVRLLSILATIATVPLVYALGRRLHSPRVGLYAAALFALAPYHLAYGSFARPYALLGFLAAAGTVLALDLAAKDESSRASRAPQLALHAALAVAGLYTHYFFLFVLGFHWLLVLRGRRGERRFLARWLAAQAVVALALLPWWPSFRAQSEWNATGPLTWSYWYAAPLAPLDMLRYAGRDVAQFLSPARIARVPGAAFLSAISYGVPVLLLAFAALRLARARSEVDRRLLWTAALWLACCFGGAAVLDLVKGSHSLDSPRYFIAATVPVYLVVAAGLLGAGAPRFGERLALALLVFLGVGSALYVDGRAPNLRYEQDARAAAEEIEYVGAGEAGDLVLVLNPGPNPMDLSYYLSSKNPDFGRLNVPARWERMRSIEAQLADRATGRRRVWLLDDHGPEQAAFDAAEAWLRARYGAPEVREFAGLALYRFGA